MSDFERIRYEEPAPRVARVVLARAEKHNAQDRELTFGPAKFAQIPDPRRLVFGSFRWGF